MIEYRTDRMMRARKKTGRCGQAMIEYAIIAVMLLAAVSILAVFLYAFKQNSGRTLDLIACEYP